MLLRDRVLASISDIVGKNPRIPPIDKHFPNLLPFCDAFSPQMLAGLSLIDRLQQKPMLAMVTRHVCLNDVPRLHENFQWAPKARPGKVGNKVAARVVERTS